MSAILIPLAQALPEGRVFGLDSQTLIQIGMQLLNGILLALALGFLLYKPVKEFLRNRAQRIQSGIDHADAAMTQAKALIAQYEAKLSGISQERAEILEAARQEAQEKSKAILLEAAEQASQIRRDSKESAHEDKKRLWEEMRLEVIDISALIAEKYIGESLDDKARDRYVDQVLSRMEEGQWPE